MRVESETSVARDVTKTMLGRGMGGINPFDGGSPFYTQQARASSQFGFARGREDEKSNVIEGTSGICVDALAASGSVVEAG